MLSDDLVQRHCTICRCTQFFETPLCDDGHGGECPEVVCVGCGSALTIGSVEVFGRRTGSGGQPGTHRVA